MIKNKQLAFILAYLFFNSTSAFSWCGSEYREKPICQSMVSEMIDLEKKFTAFPEKEKKAIQYGSALSFLVTLAADSDPTIAIVLPTLLYIPKTIVNLNMSFNMYKYQKVCQNYSRCIKAYTVVQSNIEDEIRQLKDKVNYEKEIEKLQKITAKNLEVREKKNENIMTKMNRSIFQLTDELNSLKDDEETEIFNIYDHLQKSHPKISQEDLFDAAREFYNKYIQELEIKLKIRQEQKIIMEMQSKIFGY